MTRQYSIHGITSELKRYERSRVTVTGIVSPGTDSDIDRVEVLSIDSSDMTERQIRELIAQLKDNQWPEPGNIGNPTFWMFQFTSPMLQILQAGPVAQDLLLECLDDPEIKDQIIILLGGVGDGKAVAPIIRAMSDAGQARKSAYARKVNLAANLALTNITVAGVIWHHGGGITRDACPENPKFCWSAWWVEHGPTFNVSKTPSRNYSNYPGYGIYQDPGSYRSESFPDSAATKERE